MLRPLLHAIVVWTASVWTVEAADWHVASNGAPENEGSPKSPWDIASALGGKQTAIKPGDAIWLEGGTYRIDRSPPNDRELPTAQLPVVLVGAMDKPIRVRPVAGQRVTIDGGLRVAAPSARLWIEGLEIMVSEPRTKKVDAKGKESFGENRPWGGLEVLSGEEMKFINLVIHDCQQGVGFWHTAKNCELYGCVIYDNGWMSTARGSGHAVYAQNQPDGTKTISDCILTRGYGFLMHIYGSSRAPIENFVVTRNIAFRGGERFLVGGNGADRNNTVVSNYLYNASLQFGYNISVNRTNENGVVRGNIVVDGNLEVSRYVDLDANRISEENFVIGKKGSRPDQLLSVLLPNQYDPKRAHLAVYNLRSVYSDPEDALQDRELVKIQADKFLKPGQQYRLMDPTNLFGEPVYRGNCGKDAFQVPVTGEFAAYVLFQE